MLCRDWNENLLPLFLRRSVSLPWCTYGKLFDKFLLAGWLVNYTEFTSYALYLMIDVMKRYLSCNAGTYAVILECLCLLLLKDLK